MQIKPGLSGRVRLRVYLPSKEAEDARHLIRGLLISINDAGLHAMLSCRLAYLFRSGALLSIGGRNHG
jgi:hypothetical protein